MKHIPVRVVTTTILLLIPSIIVVFTLIKNCTIAKKRTANEMYIEGFDEGHKAGYNKGHIDGEHVGYERAMKDLRPDPE